MRRLAGLLLPIALAAACATRRVDTGTDGAASSDAAPDARPPRDAGAAGGTGGSNSHGSGDGSAATSGAGGRAVVDAPVEVSLDGGDLCRSLAAAYAAALVEARRCNLAVNALQCQASVELYLECAGCTGHVQDPSAPNAVRARWEAAACALPCPVGDCQGPSTGLCLSTGGGSIWGTCAEAVP